MNGRWRTLLDHRVALNLTISACTVALVARLRPFPSEHAILAMIALERPGLFPLLWCGYYAVCGSSTYLALSVVTSLVYIYAVRGRAQEPCQPLPAYPLPSRRRNL